jgi:hypothetical protein
VPAGKYAQQILDKMGKSSEYGPAYESAVKANVVSQEDNVKAVVQKVQLGEADAGIVYTTDVTQAVSQQVKFIAIPDTYNVIASYPIAPLKDSKYPSDAQDFVNYILSSAGQQVLTKYHFIPVSGANAGRATLSGEGLLVRQVSHYLSLLSDLASCRTHRIRAKYLRWVHWLGCTVLTIPKTKQFCTSRRTCCLVIVL